MDPPSPDSNYALSGKIMLTAIVILFFVVIVMVCLHLYARWYLLNARRRQLRRARNRRTNLIFFVDPSNPVHTSSTIASSPRGIDPSVLNSLPVFLYSSQTHPNSIECAVCLSEFEEYEKGRTLPKCNHSFHIDCIDMWFLSHSTCPLCRAPVEPEPVLSQNPVLETGSSSGLCATCQHEESHVVDIFPSFNSRIAVTIEVPRRNGSFEDGSTNESPSSYRSPMNRMLSFRRILSREKRGNPSSPVGCSGGGGGSFNESDIEKGSQSQSQTEGKLTSDSSAV